LKYTPSASDFEFTRRQNNLGRSFSLEISASSCCGSVTTDRVGAPGPNQSKRRYSHSADVLLCLVSPGHPGNRVPTESLPGGPFQSDARRRRTCRKRRVRYSSRCPAPVASSVTPAPLPREIKMCLGDRKDERRSNRRWMRRKRTGYLELKRAVLLSGAKTPSGLNIRIGRIRLSSG